MKKLHVVQTLMPGGGIEKFVISMLEQDYEDTYIFALEYSAEETIKHWPLLKNYQDHLAFADMSKSGKIYTIRYLREICRKHAISVVHSHYTAPLLYACLATFNYGRLTRIHTEHDIWHLKNRKFRFIEQLMFSLVDNIQLTTLSDQMQVELTQYFPNKTIIHIPNSINTNLYLPGDLVSARSFFNLPSSEIIIGSAGRLHPVKGHQYLIRAMLELPERIHVAIAGNGSLFEELNLLIRELNLTHRVHMLGEVDNMVLFYQACNIFCLPSIDEGLPLSLLEAQSTNLPTVCSNVGACKEALDPESGQLVEPKDASALAQACKLVLEKKGNPRTFILNNFSFDQFLQKYHRLYVGEGNSFD